MIFIYCNWISTRWQWSVDLYKSSKETAICKWRNNTQNNTKTHNLQNRNKHTKQVNKKISPQPKFDPRTVHPVASRNTDYAKYLLTSWATITFSLTLSIPCISFTEEQQFPEQPLKKSGTQGISNETDEFVSLPFNMRALEVESSRNVIAQGDARRRSERETGEWSA